jgi:hypothetical protein
VLKRCDRVVLVAKMRLDPRQRFFALRTRVAVFRGWIPR